MPGRALDRIRCVVFDFDGTLVESNPIKRNAYYEVFAFHPEGRDALDRVLRENPRANRYGVVARARARLAARGVDPLPEAAALTAAYTRLCEERVSTCDAVPFALDALDALAAAGVPLYVDSATPEDALRRVVALRGWTHRFRDVLGGPATKVENLRAIATRESAAANAVLLVGDGPPDRDAAREFGCAFAGFEAPAPELADDPRLAPLAPLARELCARAKGRALVGDGG